MSKFCDMRERIEKNKTIIIYCLSVPGKENGIIVLRMINRVYLREQSCGDACRRASLTARVNRQTICIVYC